MQSATLVLAGIASLLLNSAPTLSAAPAPPAATQAVATASSAPLHTALSAAVADVCDRSLVLLGEDSGHGSGAAMALRAQLATELIERCGFNLFAIESQVYDFIALDEAHRAGMSPDADAVAAAFGGLWSSVRQMRPLYEYLARAVDADRVRLGGIDPQVGGATQRYAQMQLPARLSAVLGPSEAPHCTEIIGRLTAWRYDAATPYDAAERARLSGCSERVLAAHAVHADAPWRTRDTEPMLALNFAHQLRMQSSAPAAAAALRESAMAENLLWLRRRAGPEARILVWTANSHAARRGIDADRPSLAQQLLREPGLDIASIGVSASGGRQRPVGGSEIALEEAEEQDIEQLILGAAQAEVAYASRVRLAELGRRRGRAIAAAQPRVADWSQLFDGLLVMRRDVPPER